MRKLSSLLFIALAAVPVTVDAQEEPLPYRVAGGRVVIAFNEVNLQDAGLEITDLTTTEFVLDPIELENMEGPLNAFNVSPDSDLLFLRWEELGILPYGILDGSALVEGGFGLTSPSTGTSVDFSEFRINRADLMNDGPGGEPDPDYMYISTADNPNGTDLHLWCIKTHSGPASTGYQDPGDHEAPQVMWMKAWDMVITPELAAKLRRPELTGLNIGYGKLEANIAPWTGAWELPRGQNPMTPYGGTEWPPVTSTELGDQGSSGGGDGGFKDVSLGLLSGLTQAGHHFGFPGGVAGLSMSTTSCNLGTLNVPWLSPGGGIGSNLAAGSDHPGIAMNLYRQMNGRFEQVGLSWIKHGFFALSNSQCIPCQNPSNGTFLGVGCSDTYGSGNNADRTWLGPRGEWHPFDGTWDCLGSFFDGPNNDCIRSVGGGGFNSIEHRLEVFDDDLDLPGAQYYYEAMYLVRDDVDLHNNIGWRETNPNHNGNNWTFSNLSTLTEGPAIEQWGDSQTVKGLKNEGDVIVAVDTTDLGGGLWRYEYAVFNWTFNPRLREFSVPTCGFGVSDLYFHDVDGLVDNDWVPIIAENKITWRFPDVFPSPPAGSTREAGPMMYGTLYNFGFTSAKAPATRDAQVRAHDASVDGSLLLIETQAPGCTNLTADTATPAGGGVVTLEARGISDHAWFAVTAVNQVPLGSLLLFPGSPLPNAGGEVTINGSIPASASGLEVSMVVGDVTTSPIWLIELSNTLNIDIQ